MKSFRSNPPSFREGVSFGPGPLSPFIKLMLIANASIFVVQYFFPSLTVALGLTPRTFFSNFPVQIYQVLTYMFLHGSLGHIFFNMFTLWMFGTEIEYTWGTRSFARFYLLSGLAGAVLTLLVFPGQAVPMIGASGAIYGILVAYWLMFPQRNLYLYFLFPVKVKYAIPGLMILGFLMGGPNTAHMAHLGGAVCGLMYIKVDWRWLSMGKKLKSLRYQRQENKLLRRRQEAEEIMRRVDAILDKINEVGIENLTKAERKFLEEASSHLSKEQEHHREK